MGMRPLPDVLSLSWGSAQPATPGTEEIKEVIASDAILAKMAAMGVTVVAASGDYGSYGTPTATCAGKAWVLLLLHGSGKNLNTLLGARMVTSDWRLLVACSAVVSIPAAFTMCTSRRHHQMSGRDVVEKNQHGGCT